MKKIGIICAMSREIEQLLSRFSTHNTVSSGPFVFMSGVLNGCEIVLCQSGMGKVNAAMNALELIKNFSPDYVINSGVAGGLAKHLQTMDSVIGTQYVYHDVWCGDGNAYGQVQELPTFFPADKTLLSMAEKLRAQTTHTVHTGLICTGDQFISGPESVAKILQHFPQALACDMESAAIAQVCYRYHVPFMSMRLISDVAGKEQTNLAQYEDFWLKLADTGYEQTAALLSALAEELTHE